MPEMSAPAAPVTPAPVTDLNRYLRLADVEAMLDLKINHCEEQAYDYAVKLEAAAKANPIEMREIEKLVHDLRHTGERRSALAVAKRHLANCEQFVLTHQPDAATPDLLRVQNGQPVEMVR